MSYKDENSNNCQENIPLMYRLLLHRVNYTCKKTEIQSIITLILQGAQMY